MLLKIGPCQQGKDNDYDFPNTGTSTRKFQKSWYTKRLPNGLTVERQWLTYSPVKNGMFCFPCLLFSNKSAHGYDKTFAEASARCQNYKKGAEKIDKLENSVIHGEAVAKMLVTTHTLNKDKSVIKPFLDAEL